MVFFAKWGVSLTTSFGPNFYRVWLLPLEFFSKLTNIFLLIFSLSEGSSFSMISSIKVSGAFLSISFCLIFTYFIAFFFLSTILSMSFSLRPLLYYWKLMGAIAGCRGGLMKSTEGCLSSRKSCVLSSLTPSTLIITSSSCLLLKCPFFDFCTSFCVWFWASELIFFTCKKPTLPDLLPLRPSLQLGASELLLPHFKAGLEKTFLISDVVFRVCYLLLINLLRKIF